MLPLTRQFLASVPNLGALMDQVVVESEINVNNFEDLRLAREAGRETAMTRLRETQGLHTVIQFPELTEPCPTCSVPLKGGYLELNNVGTGKVYLVPMFVWHQFIEHGVADFTETVVNLGNSRVADRPMPLDFKALVTVMARSAIPAEVQAELQAFFAAASTKGDH